jgi:hypothetical protein
LKALSIIKHHLGPFCQALPQENGPIISKISLQNQKNELNQFVKKSPNKPLFHRLIAACQTSSNAASWNLITLLNMTAMSFFLKRYRRPLTSE